MSVIVNKMVDALHTLHVAASVLRVWQNKNHKHHKYGSVARNCGQEVTKTSEISSSTKKATEILMTNQSWKMENGKYFISCK